ncbi:MAG: hypothetical protein Kow0079_09670 [Vicingaceae bacterium]|jgi:hypothetical protein
MFEFTKKVLLKVSFDKELFRKELRKARKWLKPHEMILLKSWCLITFVQYKDVILETFDAIYINK